LCARIKQRHLPIKKQVGVGLRLFAACIRTHVLLLPLVCGERFNSKNHGTGKDPIHSASLPSSEHILCEIYHDTSIDTGMPKTIPWNGPTIVVYTQGKLDVGKGDQPNRSSRKYYQWCCVCCRAGCGNETEGADRNQESCYYSGPCFTQ